MRIVGGSLKGRKILNPLDKSTRPLKDMVRESIFNILEHSKNEFVELKKSKVLDLFSGTGSFGIECLSRGAENVFFFENHTNSIKILKKNLNHLKLQNKSKIYEKNVYNIHQLNFNSKKFDLVFLDPPFKENNVNQIIIKIKKLDILNKKALVVMHRNNKINEEMSKHLKIIRIKNYGLSKIIFGNII